MGKLASWLSAPAKAAPAPLTYPTAHLSGFDAQRLTSLRYALGSRALGQPTQDYNRLAAHQIGVVQLAVNLLATLVSNAKVSLWEINEDDPDGATRLPWNDPICHLYRNPNPVDTAQDFWYQQVQQRELTGMGLVWAPPDRDPNKYADVEVREMWSMPRVGMTVHPPTPDFPQGYWYAQPYGMYGNFQEGYAFAGAKLPVETVMVWKNPHPYFRWEGYAVLSAIAQSVDTIEAIELARLAAQQNGCEQSVAIEFEKDVKPDQPMMDRIRSEWERRYMGPANTGKLIFTGGGAKINKFATTPAEMAFQEGWAQLSEFVLAAYGTPKALVGMVEGMTHATLFGTLKANHLTKLEPLLNSLAARHGKDIITPYYTDRVFLKLEASAIHDDELVERQLVNDLRAGVRKLGEIRRLRGLDTTGEEWENERAFATGPKQEADAADGDESEQDQDPDGEKGRDKNVSGNGSLGPRNGKKGEDRAEKMLHAMEPYLRNGIIKPLDQPNGRFTMHMSKG